MAARLKENVSRPNERRMFVCACLCVRVRVRVRVLMRLCVESKREGNSFYSYKELVFCGGASEGDCQQTTSLMRRSLSMSF